MKVNEVKFGAILAYILIIANALYGMLVTPYILGTIGESEYGVYKTIGSLTTTISVMEFGLGGTMQKFIAQYRAQKEKEKCFNFSAMCMIQTAILAVCMVFVGIGLYFTIDPTYGTAFTLDELCRAKQIYVVLLLYVVLHFFENIFWGIIAGYNRFVFINCIKIWTLIVKIGLYFLVLPIFRNSLVIVLISLFVEIVIIVIEYIFVRKVLHHQIRYSFWDRLAFKESFSYTFLLFLQSLIIQFNGNIDNIVIGAVIGTSAVTIYSFAIQMFNMYEQCATSISSVILPSVTNLIYNGATSDELENIVVKYGRVQWSVLGGALGAFICLGQEFLSLWLGEGFEDCYYLSLILIVPVTFPLIVNVCLAILKAKNLLLFRTIALGYSAVLNVILTVIGTQRWGYWAAAIGTAVSTVVGSVISLNIYYQYKLKINIFNLYIKIFRKISPCILIACTICLIMNYYGGGTWFAFIVKALLFVIVYGLTMFFGVLTKDKRKKILRRGGEI